MGDELNVVEKHLAEVIKILQKLMTLPKSVVNEYQVEAKSSFAAIFRKNKKVYIEFSNEQLTEIKMIETKIKNYLKTSIVNMNTDPLLWWQDHEKDFLRISKAAEKYLTVQKTSIASERVLSKDR